MSKARVPPKGAPEAGRPGGVSPELITPSGIAAVLAFLPYSTDVSGSFGDWQGGEKQGNTISMPYVVRSKRADAFVRTCYDHHFVQEFDWGAWADANRALVHDESGLDHADLESVVRLLTTHIRADRFSEGHLLAIMQSGLLGRILARLKAVSDSPESK